MLETPNNRTRTRSQTPGRDSSVEHENTEVSHMRKRSPPIAPIGIFLPLIGLLVSSCAEKNATVRMEQQSQAAHMPGHSATMPNRLWGIWAMGETPCSLPINTDADGMLVVSEKKMQGYEYYVTPKKVVLLSENPLRITLEGTEVYLGSQIVDVTQTITVEEGKLRLTDGQTTETYVKCK